ncbi:MAG: C25 family cysteine peptidase [Flavisolibacter sp.]
MKKILFGLLITWGFAAKAQVYNNEWIDYSQTYYKFKLGKTGLYRISQSTLTSAGLGNTPAEYFQLWHNGKQVPVYTSIPSGVFSSTDYLEFWGLMNDGKPDRQLYRDPSYQLNDKWSLETDTSTYFLTVHTDVSANLRLSNTVNSVSGTTLTPEPYFMYTTGKYYHDKINGGYAQPVGEYLYSASYDIGEGWSSVDIFCNASEAGLQFQTLSYIFNDLNVYPGGPSPYLKIAASGNAINTRRYKASINSDSVMSREMDFFTTSVDTASFPLTKLNSVRDTVSLIDIAAITCAPLPTGCQSDRMVVHQMEITYPRKFNFGGASNFEFSMPASATGNFLKISNFSYGTSTPVLYDLTNGQRYVADLSAAPLLQFVLQPSLTPRNLVLVSEEATNLNNVASLETRNFINYTLPAYEGDYMIITNPVLFAGPNGTNPILDYKAYRSSPAGGSYKSQVYLSDELVDQFGFGIKKNPAGLWNFIRYAKKHFSVFPKQIFIIGHGLSYPNQLAAEPTTDADLLNLVPTFGFPASDVLLSAEPGSSAPEVPVGRLSAINALEVATYLKKVKDYEAEQASTSGAIKDKAWMKNIVHIIGAGEPGLDALLSESMKGYERIIRDTLFGANVETFSKSSSDYIEQLNSTRLTNLFSDGISLITYFGHSSTNTLEFNLDNPQNYNNFKKYPMFIGLGCNAGDFFRYNPARLQTNVTLSENYVFSPDRGTIGFIASTHFGIVHYLDIWAEHAYQEISSKSYGKTIGEIMKATTDDVFAFTTQEDFYARCNAEESELHGDPAIRVNAQIKPDYVLEDPNVRIIPGFVSVADSAFKIDVKVLNLGKAPDSSIVLEVKRVFPDNSVSTIRQTIPGIRYEDSVTISLPINPTTDKGLNHITVTIDPDNRVDELFENNNTITKDLYIYEDETRPVFPYNYAIVNHQGIKMMASTANPFATSKQYQMELDTTELFNSPLKVSKTLTSAGGVMSFDPGINFMDSVVYYWRVAPVVTTGTPVWNEASFIYLANSENGFSQAHYFQHLRSTTQGISLDSASRTWKYGTRFENLFIREGSWVTSTGQESGLSVAVNGAASIRNTCYFQSVVFNVFDPTTFQPMFNSTLDNQGAVGHGLYGSAAISCNVGRQNNFEFRWDSVSNRKRAMDFMKNTIPDGAYVVVRSFLLDPVAFPQHAAKLAYASDWQADEAINGPGESLYQYLKNAGFTNIDSFNRPRQFVLVYKKNDPSFTPKWIMTENTIDNVTLSVDCAVPDTVGLITSPEFGPSRGWKNLIWDGTAMESTPGDNPRIDLVGITQDGIIDTVMRNVDLTQKNVDISAISAAQYPFLKLHMRNADAVNNTPYQLGYWRLTDQPAPEGAIAPNLYFNLPKDTVDVAEPLDFQIGFKNVSEVPFTDSLKIKLVVTDQSNVQHVLPVMRQRPLPVNDTLHVHFPIDTRQLVGYNSLYLEVNPDNDQPEQYHFNNFAYKSFYVRGDTLNPLLDVTFDNVHILNNDIVSPKPDIVIKLKDESKWYLLNDPSKLTVSVRKFTDANDSVGWNRSFKFDGDTLQFTPAKQAPNADNTATALFKPYFFQDGKYELRVAGTDMSNNQAGSLDYRVSFEVIGKPMISNMLNYPNPFTTSTAFVFTLTGTEVPQNIKIQILTVTGKVVREITKEELGPLHIGRNITEFKWNGTDQYGQRLANGVYLYRVVTNLNGKSLDKYTSTSDDTDKYFNKGYGKMYLMR